MNPAGDGEQAGLRSCFNERVTFTPPQTWGGKPASLKGRSLEELRDGEVLDRTILFC